MYNSNESPLPGDDEPQSDSTWVCPDCGEEKCVCEECPDCGELLQDCYCAYHEEQDSGPRRRRFDDEGEDFAEPGGRSALRAATQANPRILPCPNCGAKNTLTAKDAALGYQCNRCADQAEKGF